MKLKSIVTALVMAGTFGAGAATVSEPGLGNYSIDKLKQVTNVKKMVSKQANKFGSINKSAQATYFNENKHEGKKRYIVRLVDSSVTLYKGGVKGLDAANLASNKATLNNVKFNAKSNAAKQYVSYLNKQQNAFITKASAQLGYSIPKLVSFKYAINGLVTELTFDEAKKLSGMSQVAFIEQDKLAKLNTDVGPILIGAGEVWDGTAGGSPYMGEGIVIGMIDTGVNTDHPSFAATGDDGYTVVNPLGDGVYLGDCVAEASLCSSKLIGVYSYSVVTDAYADPIFAGDTRPANGEDYNGHGSHTSSTAGGNVLDDVPFVVADFLGGNTGDGLVLPYVYPRMSGVAPHANIISYQVCRPGNTGDTYTSCPQAATVQAIDNAIADGVDVINYSIGHDPSSWTGAVELGFLSAQAAGIFVATSAGNSGPNPETTAAQAPWYTAVAAAKHGFGNPVGENFTIGTFTGGDSTPADINGVGSNGTFTGPMVWAGDFTNANDPAGDPAQCLQPFPAGTFLATQIVVCDRGAIARVQKAANAAAGGAGGFVLANIQGGASSLPGDFYVIPGIHISADDGDIVRAWLASGAGHTGTIGDVTLVRSTNVADEMAGFSSRGPNTLVQIVSPQIAAPGQSIYAAGADEQPFNDVTGPAPVDFMAISGTSMASPHIAGAGALVTQAQPSWGPDQIRSALMMTSTTAMTKNDDGNGPVATDWWDMGAGRVQVNNAINAGLVMSETEANYLAADPALGGDARTLNTPSMANFACGGTCAWTRTFTAVTAGTYTLTSSNAALTMVPALIEAVAGMNYSVVFNFDVSTVSTGDELFEEIGITAAGTPDLHMPVYVKVNNGAVPASVDIKAGRNNGSYAILGVQSIPTDNLIVTFNGLFDPNASGETIVSDFDIAVDPTNDNFDDDLTQVFVLEFDVSPSSSALNVGITNSTSTDNDLFVQWDPELDGNWRTLSQAATAAADESLSIATPAAGRYRAIVQNWASTSGLATDTGTLTVEVVPVTDPLPGMTLEAPTSADGISPLGVRLLWDMDLQLGDTFTGDITVSAGETLIGNFPISIERVADDVTSSSSTAGPVTRGDTIDYTIVVNPNLYNDELGYTVDVDLPTGTSMVAGSLVVSGGAGTIKDPNAVGFTAAEDFDIAVDPTNGNHSDDLSQVFVFEFEVPNATVSMDVHISESTSSDNDLFLEWSPDRDGTWRTVATAATTGADEVIPTIASPAAGLYRAVVQNWASTSGLATDTGVLNVNLIPARGEGFLWNATSPLSFDTFTVVSSADEPLCAAGGFGGYFPLETAGIPTTGITGDTISITAFGDRTFPFFGEERDGLTITDDGFIIFSGTSGASPWVNTALPNAAEPNDMVAGIWQDLEIFDDGTRGIRIATSGADVILLDFDEIGSFGDDTDRFSFNIFANAAATNAPGDYEYIVAYSATQVGDFSGATAGVENASGSVGVDASSLILPGVQLCYDAVSDGEEFTINFSVQTSASTLGNPVVPQITVETDLPGTQDWAIEGAPVSLVNVGPTANAGEDVTIDRAQVTEVVLDGAGTVDLDEDQLVFVWTATGGDVPLHGTGTPRAFFSTDDVVNGTYTFNLAVTDGEFSSTDEVTITIEGVSSGGDGSMGLLLMFLGIPLFFRRRYLK